MGTTMEMNFTLDWLLVGASGTPRLMPQTTLLIRALAFAPCQSAPKPQDISLAVSFAPIAGMILLAQKPLCHTETLLLNSLSMWTKYTIPNWALTQVITCLAALYQSIASHAYRSAKCLKRTRAQMTTSGYDI